jgi:hypothetical protein
MHVEEMVLALEKELFEESFPLERDFLEIYNRKRILGT